MAPAVDPSGPGPNNVRTTDTAAALDDPGPTSPGMSATPVTDAAPEDPDEIHPVVSATTLTVPSPKTDNEAGLVADPASPEVGTVEYVKWNDQLMTWEFWAALILGQVLSLCLAATSTLTTILTIGGTSMPAFQSLFYYITTGLSYTGVFLVCEGQALLADVAGVVPHDRRPYSLEHALKQFWAALFGPDHLWWRYLLLAFLDVQGNYFTLLAYRYTDAQSAQLINALSIVCVVIISATVLHVRYPVIQLIGIVECCAGVGILLGAVTSSARGVGGIPTAMLSGDFFGLLGAVLYGISNVWKEWMVSRRPMYEVLAFVGLFGATINGAQAMILDRADIQAEDWTRLKIAFLSSYTIITIVFYSLAPLVMRLTSAAYLGVSVITVNVWIVLISARLFGKIIHPLCPAAAGVIMVGIVTYYMGRWHRDDSAKSWLGFAQQFGIPGFGTARRRMLLAAEKEAAAIQEKEEAAAKEKEEAAIKEMQDAATQTPVAPPPKPPSRTSGAARRKRRREAAEAEKVASQV